MKFYIGLGGIGCRSLLRYQKSCRQDQEKRFYYINTESVEGLTAQDLYIIPNATFSRRYIGRNIVNYEIYSGSVREFFKEIGRTENVELIFCLSSFGGFGGAAIIPVMDFLEAISWEQLKSCQVIAFNEKAYTKLGFPAIALHQFQENTIEFAEELLIREQEYALPCYMRKLFNPGCTSYLIDTGNMQVDELWKCLDYSEEELKMLDCKETYRIRQSKVKRKPDVFISYSSKDQETADKIADCLQFNNLIPWIATRDIKEGGYARQIVQAIREVKIFLVVLSKHSIASEQVKNEIDRAFNRIKDGLIIVPFIIDDSELDDECQYYLCRQEMFFGEKPPIDERIRELVKRIEDILN